MALVLAMSRGTQGGGSKTAPSSVRLLDWLEGFGPEQARVVDVRRILGILSGEDFTSDWRILPSLYRTDRKKYLFHKRRIDRLLRGSPSSVNAKRPWTPRRAVLGGPVNRLPEFTEVNGFFWNDNDGNHRVVVAKRKCYLRMKGLVTRGRFKPETPPPLLQWVASIEAQAEAPRASSRARWPAPHIAPLLPRRYRLRKTTP